MNAKREARIAGLLAVLAGLAAIAAWMGETRRSDREPRAFPGGDAAWIASSGERSEESVGGNDDAPATGRASGTLAAIDPADPAFAAGRVAPASHLTTATLLAAAATGAPGDLVGSIIDGDTPNAIAWPLNNAIKEINAFTKKIKFTFDASLVNYYIHVTNVDSGKDYLARQKIADTNPLSFKNLDPGSHFLRIDIFAGEVTSPPLSTTRIALRVPEDDATNKPTIRSYAVGRRSAPVIVAEPIPSQLNVYGSAPFLRLVGDNARPDAKITFFTVQQNPKQAIAVSDQRTVIRNDGTWESSLSFPAIVGAKVDLYMVYSHTNYHVLKFSLDVKNYDSTIPKPVLSLKSTLNNAAIVPELATNATSVALFVQDNATLKTIKDLTVSIYRSNDEIPLGKKAVPSAAAELSFDLDGLPEGQHKLVARCQQADGPVVESEPVQLSIRRQPLRVVKVEPKEFGTRTIAKSLTITFDSEVKLKDIVGVNYGKINSLIALDGSNGTGDFDTSSTSQVLESANIKLTREPPQSGMSLIIEFKAVPADIYRLTIKSDSDLKDIYGNQLEGVEGQPGSDYVVVLGRPESAAEASADPRGIINTTGRYVPYQEFTEPRQQATGFNPSDKVVTRVARLYYYRDAHRVAQIINRKVKSYNRTGVDTARQLADRARQVADQKAAIRQQTERDAIDKAKKTRAKETELRHAENSLNRTLDLVAAAQTNRPADPMKQADADREVAALDATARSFAAQVERLSTEVQSLRDAENAANELVQRAESEERLSREDQFRREVAAAKADPDTYAEGKPESDDPVEQVSVSVIGEGLIQLRGPIKGVNLVRLMIDQIDAPVGQVRVAVHTVQLNGERADRMEEVADATQKQIDLSRFLTLQSGELLRRSIVEVAAARADEARAQFAGNTQKDRDQRYLYAFFGRDFIDELRTIDSEFLQSGNKLLSLHSMDTTSLSSALMLMSLARNDTRRQILGQFEAFCQAELPRAEQSYMEQGLVCPPKKHAFLKRHHPAYVSLASNARFESLRGFYAADNGNQDTMTPLQREFIRLAQIFKSRLVIELEYRQRVAERAIIEERNKNVEEEYKEVAELERAALAELRNAEEQRREQDVFFRQAAQEIGGQAETIARGPGENLDDVRGMIADLDRIIQKAINKSPSDNTDTTGTITLRNQGTQFRVVVKQPDDANRNPLQRQAAIRSLARVEPNSQPKYEESVRSIIDGARKTIASLKHYNCSYERSIDKLDSEIRLIEESYKNVGDLSKFLNDLQKFEDKLSLLVDHVSQVAMRFYHEYEAIIRSVKTDDSKSVATAAANLRALRNGVLGEVASDSPPGKELRELFDRMKFAIEKLAESAARTEAAQKRARDARHPLEHKKFLDMLIDEVEDKYIELLEGTRAHTANIDNYIKRLTTALDDDFNTQFYLPTFRIVRQTSAERYYNVQFGQIETTSILANNRAFAKVAPAASMEFDLPQRDILISEALNGAKALVNDVGALANDPTFLAAARLKSGQSGASPAPGSTGGYSVVRSVLPGLDGSTTEQVVSQNANGGQQFGSNLENLIPDPAIYKFETGTGYEIRPVIQPDGQAVVFGFHYLYTTQVREPVRADEKHLGRVKRHHIDTDVQLSNFELREVSRYIVALKASRTARGVPLFEDIPIAGALFRPAPSDESSLQQNVVLAQATIFPTLFDLMGLRWAPVLATLGPQQVRKDHSQIRERYHELRTAVMHIGSQKVDEVLRLEELRAQGQLGRPKPESIPPGYPTPDTDHPLGPQMMSPQNGGHPENIPRGRSESIPAPVIEEGASREPTNSPPGSPVESGSSPPQYQPTPKGASLRRVPRGEEPQYEQTQYEQKQYEQTQYEQTQPQEADYRGAQYQQPAAQGVAYPGYSGYSGATGYSMSPGSPGSPGTAPQGGLYSTTPYQGAEYRDVPNPQALNSAAPYQAAPGHSPQPQSAPYQGAQYRGPQPPGGAYQTAPVAGAAPPVSRSAPGYPPVRLQGAPSVPVGLPRSAVR